MSNASPEAALNKLLETATDVTDLRATRMFPGIAPKNSDLPYQVYALIIQNHDRGINTHSGFAHSRVEVNNWSDNKVEVDDLAEKTRIFLEVQTGSVTIGSNSIVISRIRMDIDDALGETASDGSDRVLHRIRQEYIVEHAVTIPV